MNMLKNKQGNLLFTACFLLLFGVVLSFCAAFGMAKARVDLREEQLSLMFDSFPEEISERNTELLNQERTIKGIKGVIDTRNDVNQVFLNKKETIDISSKKTIPKELVGKDRFYIVEFVNNNGDFNVIGKVNEKGEWVFSYTKDSISTVTGDAIQKHTLSEFSD